MTSETTTVSTATETIENQRFAVRSIERGIEQVDGVVRDLGEDAIERLDQDVHRERAGDAGERSGQTRQRMPADAQEAPRRQWDQHQVAGVGGDARQDADEDQDVRQHPAGERPPACESAPSPGRRLGDAHAQHRDDDQANRGEVHEVLDEPCVHERMPSPVSRLFAAVVTVFDLVRLRIDA